MLATIDITSIHDHIATVQPAALDHWKEAVEAWPTTEGAREENVVDAHATDQGGELVVDVKPGADLDLQKLIKFVCFDWSPKAP